VETLAKCMGGGSGSEHETYEKEPENIISVKKTTGYLQSDTITRELQTSKTQDAIF